MKQGSALYYLALAIRQLPFGLRHPLAAKRLRSQTNFLVAGQSNIGQWFFEPNAEATSIFTRRYDALSGGAQPSELWNVCSGGSALLAASAQRNAEIHRSDDALYRKMRANYWIDMATGNFGRAYAIAVKRIGMLRRKKMRFHAILWAQGEADTAHITSETVGMYREGLARVFEGLRAAAGCRQIYIQEIGAILNENPSRREGLDMIRDAQRDIASDPDVEIVSTTVDLPLLDGVHLTAEAYHVAADRMAIGIAGDERSPALVHAERLGDDAVGLRFALGSGQTLGDPPDREAIRVSDDDGDVAVENLRISGPADIRLELAPSRGILRIDYAMPGIAGRLKREQYLTVTGPLASLPIRPFSVTV